MVFAGTLVGDIARLMLRWYSGHWPVHGVNPSLQDLKAVVNMADRVHDDPDVFVCLVTIRLTRRENRGFRDDMASRSICHAPHRSTVSG